MMSCVVPLNICRGLVGLIGAIMVVIGVKNIGRDYDNLGKSENSIGSFFFFGGWALFTVSVGLLNESVTGFVLTKKTVLSVLGALFVVFTASKSQIVMYKKDQKLMRMFLVGFMLAWVVLSYAIAYSPMHASPNYLKLFIALIGAVGVIAGMIFQMKYRKRGFEFIETGTPSVGNVYSPGLPLFTGGWLFLALANAMM